MKTRVILPTLVSAALSFSACGDKGDQVSYEHIAPGEECISGGVRIIVNGEGFVSCEGDPSTAVTTELFPQGEAGNPCLTEGIRTTIQTQGEAPIVAWTCRSASNEDLEAVDADVLRYLEVNILSPSSDFLEEEFLCYEGADKEEIISLRTRQNETTLLCVAQTLVEISPSAELREALVCATEKEHARKACRYISVDESGDAFDRCEEDNWSLMVQCENAIGYPSACFEEMSSTAQRELLLLQRRAMMSFAACGAIPPV